MCYSICILFVLLIVIYVSKVENQSVSWELNCGLVSLMAFWGDMIDDTLILIRKGEGRIDF